MFTTLEIKQFCRWWVTLKTEVCINEGVTHTFLLLLDCYFTVVQLLQNPRSKSYNYWTQLSKEKRRAQPCDNPLPSTYVGI